MKTINCETIRNELTESSDEIRRLREDIHSHPELGNNEFIPSSVTTNSGLQT